MINLDTIIEYQPSLPPKPSKSSKSSEIAPLPSKCPPLIHPLPPKPDSSPTQSHQSMPNFVCIPVDQEQTSQKSSSTNAFDTELAAWNEIAFKNTTVVSTTAEVKGKRQHRRNGSESLTDNSESRSSDIRRASPGAPAEFQDPERLCSLHEELTQVIHGSQRYTTHDSAASDLVSEDAVAVTVAHCDDREVLLANDAATDYQLAETLTHQSDVGVRDDGLESQDVPNVKLKSTSNALPLNMDSSVNGETGLILQDQGDDQDSLHSCEGDHSTNEPGSIQSQDQSASVSSERNGIWPREICPVAVVIPAAQPHKPRKRPSRLRTETQPDRTDPFDESDEFDDSNDDDDDDYVDRAPHVENQGRSVKRPKYQPIANSDPVRPEAVRDLKLGDLSLPNLKTVQRGVLTCEFFPSQIMYSFSWTEDRGNSGDRPPIEGNTLGIGNGRCEVNGTQERDLHTFSTDEITKKVGDNQRNSHLNARESGLGEKRKRKKAWTDEEDVRLKRLKEGDNLPWSQILKHFPGRKLGTLQFRYYNVLKDSPSKSSVISSHGTTDRNNTPPSSPHSDRQQRIDSLSQSATESSFRSRYGPVRCRRTVERYSA